MFCRDKIKKHTKLKYLLCSLIWFSLLGLGLYACNDAGGSSDTEASVYLEVLGIDLNPDGENYPFGDVSSPAGGAWENTVTLTLASYTKDPNLTDPSPYLDVILTDYIVSYERVDIGTDVPASITGTCNITVPANETAPATLVTLYASQKLDPPLLYLRPDSYGYEPVTNLLEIHTSMKIELLGHCLDGRSIAATSQTMANFADW